MNSLKRVLNFAFVDFYRNKGISVSAIFVIAITTFLITGIFFVHGISSFLVSTIQNKIDITAYFKADTDEQDILSIRDEILRNSLDVKNIQYVSKEDALEDFKERHKGSNVLSQALLEVGENPFLPALNITTSGDPSKYEQISNILQQEQFSGLIEKVDFSQKKDTIEKVFSITSNINKVGLVLGVILILIAMLVVFNTIKLVIDRSKEEINTMRIVGASNWFVKAPFVIQGAIFGFISFIICFIVTVISIYFLSSGIKSIATGFDIISYFAANFWIVILIQLGFGIALGVISSLIVVNKYLKI